MTPAPKLNINIAPHIAPDISPILISSLIKKPGRGGVPTKFAISNSQVAVRISSPGLLGRVPFPESLLLTPRSGMKVNVYRAIKPFQSLPFIKIAASMDIIIKVEDMIIIFLRFFNIYTAQGRKAHLKPDSQRISLTENI